jgi:NitT/TauT family transport system permease protein
MPAPDTGVTERAAPSVPDGRQPPGPGGGHRRVGIGTRLLRFGNAAWRPVILLGLLLAAWWFVADQELMANYLVPRPSQVWDKFTTDWTYLIENSAVTLYETVIGFILASLLGLGTAILIVYSPTAEKTLYPIVLFAQVIPKVAIAPLLIAWFGAGAQSPKIILAVLIAFFPVVISGVAGLRSIDPELLDLSATMGATRWQTFRKIRFPNALPHLMAGEKVAVTLAVVGAVVGEFVGASEGLGYVLLVANGQLDSAMLFASLILMSAIGIVLFIVIEVAEALLVPWHASRRAQAPMTSL